MRRWLAPSGLTQPAATAPTVQVEVDYCVVNSLNAYARWASRMISALFSSRSPITKLMPSTVGSMEMKDVVPSLFLREERDPNDIQWVTTTVRGSVRRPCLGIPGTTPIRTRRPLVRGLHHVDHSTSAPAGNSDKVCGGAGFDSRASRTRNLCKANSFSIC